MTNTTHYQGAYIVYTGLGEDVCLSDNHKILLSKCVPANVLYIHQRVHTEPVFMLRDKAHDVFGVRVSCTS